MMKMAALVFPEFQTLDFFGPIELLGGFRDEIEITTVAQTRDPVISRHGQRIVVDKILSDQTAYDLLFIPGGDSALEAAKDPELMEWITQVCATAEKVLAVCTGTVLLGMTGVLDGRRATTNKLDFNDTVHLAPRVEWVKQARWVEDGKFYTASGVSAGMDAALAVAADLFGMERADEMAEGCEYAWHKDASWDPFAKSSGLV
ncbi:DJ-1/PfpI family protein [Litoreibacter ponti]|uniref:DJ-1/PfpI family protein n=1 Tax=Litoreibacter ponti TaxID=1510457 RepID=A0A2T6BDM3_9RHOB|nr:DJ-1/PfpI family protein [Litoreibacter ponti]PTX54156.1 DJ-1/PfpI family protein [Litoreibacter ponti]